jgi:hypothetical protein
MRQVASPLHSSHFPRVRDRSCRLSMHQHKASAVPGSVAGGNSLLMRHLLSVASREVRRAAHGICRRVYISAVRRRRQAGYLSGAASHTPPTIIASNAAAVIMVRYVRGPCTPRPTADPTAAAKSVIAATVPTPNALM